MYIKIKSAKFFKLVGGIVIPPVYKMKLSYIKVLSVCLVNKITLILLKYAVIISCYHKPLC